jgi:hypothetical protein
MLGDGSSFFQFLQMLSDIFNSKHIDRKPFQSRDLLKVVGARSQKSEKMHLFESTGYVIPRPSNPPGTQIETLKYSLRELKNLKQELLSEGTEVSTNDILMADIAKRFHRDIPLYEDRFIVRCPVDYRNILNLPPDYFGNAIRDAVAVFEKNEIEALSLGETALKIRQAIRSIDITSIRQSLECLNGLRKEAGIGIFENMGCPGLLVSNLSKFPIASIDFGLGSPIGFHHASLNPRLALILSSDDGLEVRFKRPLEVG